METKDDRPDFELAMLLMDIHGDIKVIKQQTSDLVARVEDHEVRLRSNEKWRWGIPGAGALAVVAGLFGFH